jgi:LysM repeat protein
VVRDKQETMRFRRSWPAVVAVLGAVFFPSLGAAEPGDSASAPAPDDLGRARLRELFVTGNGEVRAPVSPRFVSLCDPGRHGSRLLLGWVLPGVVAAEQRAELVRLAALLEQNGQGRLPARLASFGPGITVEATLDVVGKAPLLVIVIDSSQPGSSKELELAVLDVVAGLADDRVVSALAHEHLGSLARAVVEVHPRERAGTVRVSKPERHLIEPGDTLSEIASHHGLALDALVRLNGVDPKKPIHPGDELKLTQETPSRPKLYVTKPGDTLAKVAHHFGVSEKALLDINRMGAEPLAPGRKLVLPP